MMTMDEALPPRTLGSRLEAVWHVLRGHGVMYRVAVQFERSANFLTEDGLITECYFQSRDGTLPYFNNAPAAEVIGKGNTVKGMGIWDTPEEPS